MRVAETLCARDKLTYSLREMCVMLTELSESSKGAYCLERCADLAGAEMALA
jgi:hypothetical protein